MPYVYNPFINNLDNTGSGGGGGGGISTINGDVGSATGSTISLHALNGAINTTTCGSTVLFTGSGSEMDLSVSDPNFFDTLVGLNAGNASSAGNNTGFGYGVLSNVTGSSNSNACVGAFAGFNVTGNGNTALGNQALGNLSLATTGNANTAIGNGCMAALTTGGFNTGVGDNVLGSTTTGSNLIALGFDAGNSYAAGDSSNIAIGNVGSPGESNVMRIGTQGSGSGQVNTCFIAGINGNTLVSPNFVTIDTTTGQLGTAAGGGGGVSGPGSSTDRAIATWNGTGGSALFNNSTTKIDSTGRQTNSAQPCFSAYLNTAVNNVTGDLTNYQMIFDTVNFDNGSDYNTGTGLFTAPVTGRYFFSYTLFATLSASTISEIDSFLTINSATFIGHTIMPAVAGNVATQAQVTWSQIIPLTAGDTVKVNVIGVTAGSAKTVGFIGTGNGSFNTFCGYLVC